ncbi:MAG: rhodanese-like domain-containing protein [Oceanococcus sp.]
MLQISEFLGNHMLLASAMLLVLLALVANELLLIRRGGSRLSPADAVRLINDQSAAIFDLRPVADFKRGHILDAKNVPMAKLDDELGKLSKLKDKPILLCCALGSTAAQAGIKMRAQGFEKVYPMAGGVNAWQNAGLPLTSKA